MNDTTRAPENARPDGADPVYEVFGPHIFIIMSVIANRLGRSASPHFRRKFGIGLIEWRIIHVLGFESPLSAQALSLRTDFDKAAISRSLQVLDQLGWIEIKRTGRSQPRKLISITPEGRAGRDQVVSLSLARQDQIFAEVAPEKIEAFQEVLKFLMAKTSQLDAYYS